MKSNHNLKLINIKEVCVLLYKTFHIIFDTTLRTIKFFLILYLSGVCLGGTANPFSDISQSSILEKRTLHEIQYQKNGFFTKFNTSKTDSWQNSIPGKRTLPFSGNSTLYSLSNREFCQFLFEIITYNARKLRIEKNISPVKSSYFDNFRQFSAI